MDPPQGKHLEYRGAADRQYPGDSHRRRYGGGVCNGVRGLCALRIPGARHRLHPARAGGAGHAGRGAAARTGARRSRRRRRLRDPDPGFLRQTGLLGALCLSRDRHRGRLRPGAGAAVALACGHHDRVRAVVDVPLPAMRPLDGRSACVPRDRRLHPRRPARGVRLHVRPAGRARPDRADLILLARRLSGRRHADRAEQFSRRHRDDRLRPAGGRQLDRGLAYRCRRGRGRRRRRPGVRGVRRMGGPRQSRHAGAARRAAAGHRTERHRRVGLAAFDNGGDLRRGIWTGGIFRSGPLGRARSFR